VTRISSVARVCQRQLCFLVRGNYSVYCYCDRACLLARSFVRYARCDLSNSTSSIFVKFGTDVQRLRQMLLLVTSERSRSMFKVICFENDPPATLTKCKRKTSIRN